MLYVVFALPFVTALLCLALNRVLATRWLGLGAAAASLGAGVMVLVALSRNALTPVDRTWAVFDNEVIWLALSLEGIGWPLALLVCVGGALALTSLALTLPATLRGFGGLFAALLLVLLTTLAGLAIQETLLLPSAFALTALLSFIALRASGVQPAAEAMPVSLLGGLVGAIGLLGIALVLRAGGLGAVPGAFSLATLVLVGMLVLGAPPFHAVIDEQATAPSGIAGLLLALGLPLLGGAVLLRFIITQAVLSPEWRTGLLLLGLLTLLACVAGALGERRLRRLLGWLFSAQMGLLLIALGQSDEVLAVVAPSLLMNAALVTLTGYLAVALIERRAGTDDLAEIETPQALVLPGLAFLVAAASAIGLPGTWGFWARLWLFEDLLQNNPLAVPIILAASALMAVAYLAPLVVFWRQNPAPPARLPLPPSRAALVGRVLPALAAFPLLLFGLAPHIAGSAWSVALIDVPATRVAPALIWQIASGGALALLVATPLTLRWRSSRRVLADPDVQNTVPAPVALGESMRALAWIAAPNQLFALAWDAVLRVSRFVRLLLALFEQRYYLAGFMIALVAVIIILLYAGTL